MQSQYQFVGEGMSGCVHRPALKCVQDVDHTGKKVDYADTVSKLADPAILYSEIQQFEQIGKIDPKNKYHTGTPVICEPDKNAVFQQAIQQCHQKHRSEKVGLMVMKDAGKDLKNFVLDLAKMDPNDSEAREINRDFWIEMVRILQGVQVFVKSGVVHYDLKEDNITYNQEKKRANFIDFGTLTIQKTMMKQAQQHACSRCITHWSWPFETQYLNRDQYDVYQTENEALFLPVLLTLFSDVDVDLDLKTLKIIAAENAPKLLELQSMADSIPLNSLNPDSAIAIMFQEIKSPVFPRFLQDYLNEIAVFLRQHNEWNYKDFLEKSINTIDIYGVGITFLFALKHTRPFMTDTLFQDLYTLSFRMITPNLKQRYTADILLRDYQTLLKKHFPQHAPLLSRVKSNTETPVFTERICPEGKVLNPKTGRCVKIEKSLKRSLSSSTTKRVCPEGKVLNPLTGRCVKAKRTRRSTSRQSLSYSSEVL